jgi:hypothetical protein
VAIRELESTPELERDAALQPWARQHQLDLHKLNAAQRWLLFFALQWIAWAGSVAPLRRLIGALLAHTRLLSTSVIGALTGVSDRAVRKTREVAPAELIESLRPPNTGAPCKLKPVHAGTVAKYLVQHPRVLQQDVIAHVHKTLGIDIDRQTLRRFLKRYGLGCLRDGIVEDAPLFWDRRDSVELSC